MSDQIISVDQACTIARCRPSTMKSILRKTPGLGTKIGRDWVVVLAALEAYIKARSQQAKRQLQPGQKGRRRPLVQVS